jgi:TRAP-type mannitol/chloroaromatic compound transport system substrate-binding protein
MTIIKTNKQKTKPKKKLKIKIKKQSDKQRSIEIVHKGLLHMCLHINTHSNGEFNILYRFSKHIT